MKKTITILFLCAAVLIFVNIDCINKPAADPRGEPYAGAAACEKCHHKVYQSYLHTAHFMASMPANEKTVHGSFAGGSNAFTVSDSQQFKMEKFDSGLFQSYYLHGALKTRTRFDLVFGGVKGESYLNWQGDELYQLPLSYYNREHQWSTSPGYGYDFLNYLRPRSIRKQCLECHVSYISDLSETSMKLSGDEQFNKNTLVLGVDCERCHGPGAQHVAYQSSNPNAGTSRYITGYSSLNRTQKLDMCAVCHSGKPGVMLRSSFEFVPGDTFSKFKIPEFYQAADTGQVEVHGNQLKLLQSSRCFKSSTMDCATCHDTHQNTRGNEQLYAQKCIACHSANHSDCKIKDQISAAALTSNCISCHMPALPSKIITVSVTDTLPAIRFFVHTHRIAVYPQQTQQVLHLHPPVPLSKKI